MVISLPKDESSDSIWQNPDRQKNSKSLDLNYIKVKHLFMYGEQSESG